MARRQSRSQPTPVRKPAQTQQRQAPQPQPAQVQGWRRFRERGVTEAVSRGEWRRCNPRCRGERWARWRGQEWFLVWFWGFHAREVVRARFPGRSARELWSSIVIFFLLIWFTDEFNDFFPWLVIFLQFRDCIIEFFNFVFWWIYYLRIDGKLRWVILTLVIDNFRGCRRFIWFIGIVLRNYDFRWFIC